MADANVVESTQEVIENNGQQGNEIPQEVREMMEIALNGGIPKDAQQVQTQEEVQTQEQVIEQEQPVPFEFNVFKEKFGYERPEQVLEEIEQLRSLKENPPKAEIEYANEESKTIALLLAEGKQDEVYSYLSKKMEVDRVLSQEVTANNADEIIKLAMKANYSSLNDEQINHKFNRQYNIPKEPVQSVSEDDDEFAVRHNEWKELVSQVQMDKIIDAKMAMPTLEKLKQDIVLPKIESTVDEGYLAWQKSLDDLEKQDALTKEAYKSLQPKDVETKLNFVDEANKINFEFQFQPDGDGFKKAVEIASDMEKFYQTFFDSEGNPNRQMFVDAIYFAMNKQKVISEAIKQGSNARMKAILPDNNYDAAQRQAPQEVDGNSLDALMKASLRIGGVNV